MSRWQVIDGRLCRTFRFADFNEAFGFMVRAALVAEQHGHHPEWSNAWNVVRIALCTHDAGGAVTEKDHRLAEAIDRLAPGMPGE
jgi:4a-hydroxytetrahydrobiopterin dehydratase